MPNPGSPQDHVARVLRGTVVPAVPVPFTAAREIDVDGQHAYARWMATQGVGAVAVWSHTGRGLDLSDEQRREVLHVWRAVPHAPPVICGVGVPERATLANRADQRTGDVMRIAVAMAQDARDGGACAVMVHPPRALSALPDGQQRVVELHREVARVGLPVLAFVLYERASGLEYGPDLLHALLALDGVFGVKIATLDSVMTFQDLAGVVARHPGKVLLTGEDRFLGYSLMLGAQTALIGLGAACTDACVDLMAHWVAGRIPQFVRQASAVDAFASATFRAPMDGYVQRMLWALEADGVLPGPALDPFGPALTEADRDAVRRAVARLRCRPCD